MDRINFRQFLAIIFLVVVSMKIFMLPAYLIRISGEESFLVMAFECAIDLVLLFVVIIIMRKSSGNFFETLNMVFGKVIARIIAAALALFYLVKLFLLITEFRMFFSVSVFEIPLPLIHILPFLVLLVFVSGKRLTVIGRAAELVIPLVIIGIILLGAFSAPSVNLSNILPLWISGEKLSKGIMSFPMWFGDTLLLFLFIGKTEKRKRLYFSFIPAIISVIIILFFSMMMFSLYANIPEVLFYGHNISNMTQYSTASFQFGRFDLLLFCMWSLGMLVTVSITMLMVSRLTNFVIRKNTGIWPSIIIAGGLMGATVAFSDANVASEYIIKYFSYPAMVLEYVFPLVFLTLLLIKNAVTKRKNNILLEKKQEDGGVKNEKANA